MNRFFFFFILLFLNLSLINAYAESPIQSDVIYGEDNRKDLYEIEDQQILNLVQSTVALVRTRDLTAVSEDKFSINLKPYGESKNLCEDEAFYNQPLGPYCSGFLVAPNKIMTAGHCIRTESNCQGVSFVFGFNYDHPNKDLQEVSKNEVYFCKKLIHSVVNGTGHDFAVVELDREVADHAPLSIRQEGEIQKDTPVFVAGHPVGLPLKVAGGAQVREVKQEFFVANLDTFGGNSGSAVFNAKNGQIEGILVRGETDFVFKTKSDGTKCRASNFCTDSGCRGEDVTKITEALDYL
ncbi:MAG: trypsin-like peptidase domain-containing protein [Bdellovibrionales bacterium]|nr:trypsin-like peptidase domain-containing protein [Bdellovibrionales bacterium]